MAALFPVSSGHSACPSNIQPRDVYAYVKCRYCFTIHHGYGSWPEFHICTRCKHRMPWDKLSSTTWHLHLRCWSCDKKTHIRFSSGHHLASILNRDRAPCRHCEAPVNGAEVYTWIKLDGWDEIEEVDIEEMVRVKGWEWRESNRMVEAWRSHGLVECGKCGLLWKGQGSLTKHEKVC